MKYYYYISEAKIDMLLPQIIGGQGKVSTEFKADIKVLSATRKSESEESTFSRLEKLSEFIHEYGDVGSVDDPGEYVFDSLELRWGPYGRTEEAANPLIFFAGATDRTVVGLGGSRKHLIGEEGHAQAHSASGTALFARYLIEALELSEENSELYQHLKKQTYYKAASLLPDNKEYLGLMAFAAYNMSGPTERLEFLAKKLLHGQLEENGYWKQKDMAGKFALMATPIYVARVDIPRDLDSA